MWSLQYEAMKQLINFGYFTFQPLQETSHLVFIPDQVITKQEPL